MGAWGEMRAWGGQLGRYSLYDRIAAGGMASIHLGRLRSEFGFTRTVAIKRLHPQFAADQEFVAMFLDEARLAARVRHTNVVPILDVQAMDGELFLVMDYITGESLSQLFAKVHGRGEKVPPEILSAILIGALYGLHAAHEATSDAGEPLRIVHRDISPHNILVGIDGTARVADFGIAKAAGRLQETASGDVKGKLLYMAPEQLASQAVDRRADVYSAGVVAWEGLTGRRLFGGAHDPVQLALLVAMGNIAAPSTLAPEVPAALDAVVTKALSTNAELRYPTAAAFAEAIEAVIPPASSRRVGEWVANVAESALLGRAQMLEAIERSSDMGDSSLGGVLAAIRSSSSGLTRATTGSGPAPASARPEDADLSRSKVNVTLSNAPAGRGGHQRTIFGVALLVGALFVVVASFSRPPAPAPSPTLAAPPGAYSLPPWPVKLVDPPFNSEASHAEGRTEPHAPAPAISGSAVSESTTPRPSLLPTSSPRPARHTTAPLAAPTGEPVSAARPNATTSAADASVAPVPDPCANPYYFEGGIKKIRAECIH
jgi:serine/threonine protein kinase